MTERTTNKEMPNAAAFNALSKMAKQAGDIPGEPIDKHRARFEKWRHKFESEKLLKKRCV